MGLDITAYSNLRHLGHCPDVNEDDHEYDPETYDRIHVQAFAYDAFPHALAGLPDVRTDLFGSGDAFLTAGCFEVTDKTETHRFRAGSYSGYNMWRDDLRRQFNPETDPAGPFYELIWFADNEGTIATEAARALLVDFRQLAPAYAPAMSWADYARRSYADWTRAFELAADGGLVDFH